MFDTLIMRLEHVQQYEVKPRGNTYTVVGKDNVEHFVAPVTKRGPKLYVVSRRGTPVYVGITFQSMATRLNFGFRAAGQGGYYGYRWKKQRDLKLDIWLLKGVPHKRARGELETVEAEVVFAIRQTFSQWPQFQTEIHFHRSFAVHRRMATSILRHLKHGSGN